jgi:hypothetical protein
LGVLTFSKQALLYGIIVQKARVFFRGTALVFRSYQGCSGRRERAYLPPVEAMPSMNWRWKIR